MHILDTSAQSNQATHSGSSNDSESVHHIIRLLGTIRIQENPLPVRNSHERRMLPEAPSSNSQRGTRFPGQYPAHILESAGTCERHQPTDAAPFHVLWRQVLSYWFPVSQSYALEEYWNFRGLETISFAVLRAKQPVLLLDLRGVTEAQHELTRHTLRTSANQLFDKVAIWSGYPALCVVSAIGTKWNTFIRPTDMTSETAETILGYDWYGEWSEEIASPASHEALGRYFGVLKRALTVAR